MRETRDRKRDIQATQIMAVGILTRTETRIVRDVVFTVFQCQCSLEAKAPLPLIVLHESSGEHERQTPG